MCMRVRACKGLWLASWQAWEVATYDEEDTYTVVTALVAGMQPLSLSQTASLGD